MRAVPLNFHFLKRRSGAIRGGKMTLGRACLLLCSMVLWGVLPAWGSDSTVASAAPRYTDPLAGLYPSPAGTLPRDVELKYYAPGGGTGQPGRAVLTMALVPGANYHKVRSYM